jgi:hypothetical protein
MTKLNDEEKDKLYRKYVFAANALNDSPGFNWWIEQIESLEDSPKEECKQCRLENNKGICDRKDCSNYTGKPKEIELLDWGYKFGKDTTEDKVNQLVDAINLINTKLYGNN